MKTLKELKARIRATHPINGHFKVAYTKPYSFEMASEGVSTNTQAYDRICSDVGSQTEKYGYTEKQAYLALYFDTKPLKGR